MISETVACLNFGQLLLAADIEILCFVGQCDEHESLAIFLLSADISPVQFASWTGSLDDAWSCGRGRRRAAVRDEVNRSLKAGAVTVEMFMSVWSPVNVMMASGVGKF